MTETPEAREARDTRDALFRSLSDPPRRALFERLCREGEKTVVELTQTAGVSQPVASEHLRKLREAGLVEGREDGRKTHYAARPVALEPLADCAKGVRARTGV